MGKMAKNNDQKSHKNKRKIRKKIIKPRTRQASKVKVEILSNKK